MVLCSTSMFTTIGTRKLMLKSREICVGLWTGATAMMKEKYDDAMVCTNIYKYICMYIYKYVQKVLFSAKRTF